MVPPSGTAGTATVVAENENCIFSLVAVGLWLVNAQTPDVGSYPFPTIVPVPLIPKKVVDVPGLVVDVNRLNVNPPTLQSAAWPPPNTHGLATIVTTSSGLMWISKIEPGVTPPDVTDATVNAVTEVAVANEFVLRVAPPAISRVPVICTAWAVMAIAPRASVARKFLRYIFIF